MVRLHALGALRATTDDREIPIGGPRQRRLLAVLLVHSNQVVSTDRLAEAVFEGRPTPAAATTLRSYVARLRRVLEQPDDAPRGPTVLTQPPGYRLVVAPDDVDVAQFESLVAQGRAALHRDDPAAAAPLLRDALALWEGDAYAEFADEPWAYADSQRLGELRLHAHEQLAEAELACGRAEETVPRLEALRHEHPLREGLRLQLVTAYYRTGRQADALAELRSFRESLAEELGLDPSPALVELEHRILVQDPGLDAASTSGQPLRGYRLGERLGTGTAGTVHAARLPGVDRDFVVRVMGPEIADDPGFVRAFEATARRVAALRHPGIAAVHDFWREPGAAYVVSRRLPGGTLGDRLRRGPLTRHELTVLVDRVGGALTVAAAAGLVHGRVDAEDVLLDEAGDPVLTDFWFGPPRPGLDPARDLRDFAGLVETCLGGPGVAPPLVTAVASGADTTYDVARFTAALHDLVSEGRAGAGPRPNPYVGLQPFDEADAPNFFGRDRVVAEMLARLGGEGVRSRLVLLVGASGTGKSSVVRAGLLPRVRAGAVAGSESWYVAVMLPDGSPYAALAACLRGLAVTDTTGLADRMAADPGGIDTALRDVVPGGEQLLLVVDQLEELFTLSAREEQRRFLEGLARAVQAPDSRLHLVATLRADHYDRPLASQPFGALVNDATVTIPAMLPAEVEAAVVEPATRAGRTVERALAAELVAAVADEPWALPALEFVLFDLAEHHPEGQLTVAAYHALGGLEGAVASRAEELYLSLGPEERDRVRWLFEQLVAVPADGEPRPRRAARPDLVGTEAIVEQWVRARLLALDVDPHTRVPTVALAHDALLRRWPRLRQWVEADRSQLVALGRLRHAVQVWEDLGRDPSSLHRGVELESAAELARSRTDLSTQEREFVEAGLAAREQEQERTREVIREQARTNRWLRLQRAALAGTLVAALVGGFLAVDQRQQAVAERHLATGRALAAAARASVPDDPERGILLALAAVDATRRHGEPVLPEALEALHRSVSSSRLLLTVPGVGGRVDWSADGRHLVTLTRADEGSGAVDLRDPVTGRSLSVIRAHHGAVGDASVSGDSRLLATTGEDGWARIWTVGGALVSQTRVPRGGPSTGPALSPDGTLAAAAWPRRGVVRVTEARSGAVVASLRVARATDTAFSPDGEVLAVGSAADARVRFFTTGSARLQQVADTRAGATRAVAWSPDGRWLAVATESSASVLDARTGRVVASVPGHQAPVNAVDWSPDSSLLATGSDDGTARVHEVAATGIVEVAVLGSRDLHDGVQGVAFSADGERLVAADRAATATQVWDVRDTAGAEVANFPATAVGPGVADFGADGATLWLPDRSGTLSQWDLATLRRTSRLRPVRRADAGPWRLALSPDGGVLAAAGPHLPLPVWDTRTGQVLHRVGAGWQGVVADLAWSGDGRWLAVGVNAGGQGRVELVDREGRGSGTLTQPPGVLVRSLALDDDGARLATTGTRARDGSVAPGVHVWDRESGALLLRLDTVASRVVFDPAGQLVATSRASESTAETWDATSGRRVTTFTGHTGMVTDLAFDAAGTRIATSSTDGSVRVWRPRSGTEVVALHGPTSASVSGARFSPDGTRLASTSRDGVVRVWALTLDELVTLARGRLTRGLTDDECRQYLQADACPDR